MLTLLANVRDEEITPVIQRAIGKFLQEIALTQNPHLNAAQVEMFYRKQHQPLYEALALLITKELKNHVKETSTNPDRGASQIRKDHLRP